MITTLTGLKLCKVSRELLAQVGYIKSTRKLHQAKNITINSCLLCEKQKLKVEKEKNDLKQVDRKVGFLCSHVVAAVVVSVSVFFFFL